MPYTRRFVLRSAAFTGISLALPTASPPAVEACGGIGGCIIAGLLLLWRVGGSILMALARGSAAALRQVYSYLMSKLGKLR